MSTTTAQTLDVAIAGAGPIGMTLAMGLGLDGHRVTVFERGEELSDESRASTFHPSTLEKLADYDVVDAMLERGLKVPDYQYRDRTAGMIAKLSYDRIADETRFPYRLQIEQSRLTRIILEKLKELPNVTVQFSTSVEQARNTGPRDGAEDGPSGSGLVGSGLVGSGVDVTVRGPSGERVEHFDHLVGADGSNSAVRRSLDLAFDGITYPERYLVVSTPFEFRDVMPDISWVNYISDPHEWLLMLRTPDYWRILFPLRPEADAEHERSPERVQERLHSVYDLEGDFPVLHTSVYNVHQRVAAAYAVGAIALAGDAAHINNPLGGLGMNSGLFDAFALREAFARIAAGEDAAQELAAYSERQRSISVDYVGAQTDRNWSQLRETDPARRHERDQRMREVVSDPAREKEFLMRVSMLKTKIA